MEQTNLDIYGNPPIPWSRAEQLLDAAVAGTEPTSSWRRCGPTDGPTSPASAPCGSTASSTSSAAPGRARAGTSPTRSDCVISVSLPGLDLVVEGTAAKVTDEATLQRLAELYNAQGWPATVKDGAFTAPTARRARDRRRGTSTSSRPRTAFGVASAEPHGATRWRFDG